jgi:hypothetical protein
MKIRQLLDDRDWPLLLIFLIMALPLAGVIFALVYFGWIYRGGAW